MDHLGKPLSTTRISHNGGTYHTNWSSVSRKAGGGGKRNIFTHPNKSISFYTQVGLQVEFIPEYILILHLPPHTHIHTQIPS